MMKHQVLGIAIFALFCVGLESMARAQEESGSGELPSRFTAERKEVGIFCGPFLPNQIPGITETMPLCGVRLGLKVNDNTWLEPAFISGAGNAQQYRIGTLNFRSDVAYEDLIASMYIGPDIHVATQPLVDAFGNSTGDQTNIYFGGHVGGSIWGKLNDVFYFRTDMTFNFSPGTSLFIGFGLVFRFDPGSSGGK